MSFKIEYLLHLYNQTFYRFGLLILLKQKKAYSSEYALIHIID